MGKQMRGRGLTEIEKALIDEYFNKGMSAPQIAAHLTARGFPRKASGIHPYILRKFGKQRDSNCIAYSDTEENVIVNMYTKGYLFNEIAAELSAIGVHRTAHAIAVKIERLRDKGYDLPKPINHPYHIRVFMDTACRWLDNNVESYAHGIDADALIKDFRNEVAELLNLNSATL